MRVIDLIHQLLPAGTDAAYLTEHPTAEVLNRPGGARATFPSYSLCPIWPPDLFAVVGAIIDRSGCYTEASPDRTNLSQHEEYIFEVRAVATSWESMLLAPPQIQDMWHQLVSNFGMVSLEDVCNQRPVVEVLLKLFAIADEASVGMGWDKAASGRSLTEFALNVLINAADTGGPVRFRLPYWPTSLCGMVSPSQVIVLPKSLTTNKGCTIRSLSHHLALLPSKTTLDPSWFLVSRQPTPKSQEEIRLLLVPFPFAIPDGSFELASSRSVLNNGTSHAAFFRLRQLWLRGRSRKLLSGQNLADEIILPLIRKAKRECGSVPHGVVLPECALSPEVADDLVASIAGSGIEFLITGVLQFDESSGRWLNQAKTYAIVDRRNALPRQQNKHHRWRIDRVQADAYGLDIDQDPNNDQWWEDIGVTHRTLPFYALRQDMSMVTLICEDLARMDPAMSAIRAIGPNLVVALLMDGPQLRTRWPGRYAGVLADEPGCAVLSLTCAAMVDRSNSSFGAVKRTVALWSQADGLKTELDLPPGHSGILLTLRSLPKHQTTLDNRSDGAVSRELIYFSQHALRP